MTDQPAHVPDPPAYAIEVEQALLGAIFVNEDAYYTVASFLQPDHFIEPLHGDIYSYMADRLQRGRRIDPKLMAARYADLDLGGGVKGPAYMARLATCAVSVVLAGDFGLSIFEAYVSRRLAQAGDVIKTEAAAGGGYAGANAEDLLAQAEQEIADVRRLIGAATVQAESIADTVRDLMAENERVEAGEVVVPSTGFVDLDRAFAGGWRPKRQIVLAGRPGMGKTALLIEAARRVAANGFGTAIFSLEIDKPEVTARLLASQVSAIDRNRRIEYRDILAGKTRPEDADLMRQAGEQISALPISIDDAGDLTIAEIEARARVIRSGFARRGIRLAVIWVDYLQLCAASDRYRGNRTLELAEVAKGGKDLSKRLDCTTILLSQLSRAVEARDDKRPLMSDLRDSGAIEENADVVGMLYRPAYYAANDEAVKSGQQQAMIELARMENDLEIRLAKNRLGPPNTITLWADVASASIDNSAKRYEGYD